MVLRKKELEKKCDYDVVVSYWYWTDESNSADSNQEESICRYNASVCLEELKRRYHSFAGHAFKAFRVRLQYWNYIEDQDDITQYVNIVF